MEIASKNTVLTGLELHFYIQQGIFHVCDLDFRWELFLQEVRLKKKLACQGFVGIKSTEGWKNAQSMHQYSFFLRPAQGRSSYSRLPW